MGGSLQLINVSRSWNGFQLKNINLNIKPGEYFVLIGPTGAGKTLLLETIQGFHPIQKGRILLNTTEITSQTVTQRSIGYVPQTPNLNPNQTVRQNLEFILRRRNLHQIWSKEVDGIIQMMKLGPMEDKLTLHLSGGEKRKVALARALILKPQIILLDEPLSSLDITSKQHLKDEIKMIHNYLDLTVIHVTHDQQEALDLADKLGIIRNGRIVNTGTIEEIFQDPKDEYAARFLGYNNIYDATLQGKNKQSYNMKVRNIIIRARNPSEQIHGKIGIHSNEITITTKAPKTFKDNIFRATVKNHNHYGPTTTVTLDIGIPITIHMSRRRFQKSGIIKNQKVWIRFPTKAVKQLTA